MCPSSDHRLRCFTALRSKDLSWREDARDGAQITERGEGAVGRVSRLLVGKCDRVICKFKHDTPPPPPPPPSGGRGGRASAARRDG